MMTIHDVVTPFLLLLSISIGYSFQPLVKVNLDHAVSTSIRTIAERSRIPTQQSSPIPHHGPSSVLQMGFVEDFLSGADASQREVENNKYIAELQQRVTRINDLESIIEELGDDELEQKTMEFKHRVQQKGESINGPLLEEAFAVVREAAWYVYSK